MVKREILYKKYGLRDVNYTDICSCCEVETKIVKELDPYYRQ